MCGRYYIDVELPEEVLNLIMRCSGEKTGGSNSDEPMKDVSVWEAGQTGIGAEVNDNVSERVIVREAGLSGFRGETFGTSRDIHPSDYAPVIIVSEGEEIHAVSMRWGFEQEHDGQLLINARSESVLDRKSFTESVLSRRCVVPASYFYEWDRDKNKCICRAEDGAPLMMAGIYKRFGGEERFTIITTNANKSMRTIHDRMPLILRGDEITDWLKDGKRIFELLKKEPDALKIEKPYEQLSLF